VEPDSGVESLHRGEQRVVAFVVRGQVDRVCLELYAERPELANGAHCLLGRSVWVLERRCSDPASEVVGIPLDELCCLLVVAADKLDQSGAREARIGVW